MTSAMSIAPSTCTSLSLSSSLSSSSMSMSMSTESVLSKTIAMNHAGIDCLLSNNFEKAVKLFSVALSTHQNLKTVFSSQWSSVATRRTSFPQPSSSQGNCEEHNDVDGVVNNHHVDLFLKNNRRRLRSPAANYEDNDNGDEDDDEVVFCDPICLPSVEELVHLVCDTTTTKDTDQNRQQQQERHCFSPLVSFLTTCHSYNLALAHHLCGINHLRSAKPSSETNHSNDDLNFAGRLYELAMRSERRRCDLRAQQQQLQHRQTFERSPQILSWWFSTKFVLACLNNLGHLHCRAKNYRRSGQCFLNLQKSAIKLRELCRSRRHLSLQTDAESCLPIFLMNAHQCLSRFANDNTDDESNGIDAGDPSSLHHSLPSSSSPPSGTSIEMSISDNKLIQRKRRYRRTKYYLAAAAAA